MTNIRALALAICAFANRANADEHLKTIHLAAVREELLQMVKEDQDARSAVIKAELKDPVLWDRVTKIDEKNTDRLKSLVAQHGWLGKSQVGEDGAHAAWLLVQHADRDRMFQRDCLEKMKQSFKDGEVSGKDLAYLVDRVAVAEKKKQIYGTQFQGTCGSMKPQPIEDEQHVDDRRKSVGLTTMAESEKQMQQTYNCKPKTD